MTSVVGSPRGEEPCEHRESVVVEILTDLLDAMRWAKTITDCNVAAGIAHQSLTRLSA